MCIRDSLDKNPRGAEVLLHALDFILGSPIEFVVAGDPEMAETQDLLREINQRFLPSKVILFKDSSKQDTKLLKLIPFLQNQNAIGNKPTVYACRNQTCDRPQTTLKDLILFLEKQN